MELEGQKLALYWKDKPIGLVVSKITMPYEGIYSLVWHGTCLGETVKGTSAGDAAERMSRIALDKKLNHIVIKNGADVTTLYTPAFEE